LADATAFDHIAIGLERLEDATDFLVGELGGTPAEGGPGPGYRWAQWTYAGNGRIEVLEPEGPPDGFMHRFLARNGPGIHHVTFKVPSLRAAADAAERLGYDVVGYRDENPGWKEAFLHPKRALGIVVQLAQVQADLDEENWGSAFPFPTAPEPRGEPVRVVGLRMTVRTEARARRQWEELLGGMLEKEDGVLVFRWPTSPMRIAVSLAPDREEGPVGIEVGTQRNIDLRTGPARLGVPFIPVDDR
jgi:methylmalonyl-CoA/ethylmalonyl-CoA epimerase